MKKTMLTDVRGAAARHGRRAGAGQADAAAEMGGPGAVRRLLVAKDKGFYKEAGLDVTIKPGGPDIAPPQVIAGGGADVVVEWMPAALAAREKGVALVNIAQPFKRSGMMLTCRAETGIKTPADLKGRRSASGSSATSIRSCPGWPSSATRPTAAPAASRS